MVPRGGGSARAAPTLPSPPFPLTPQTARTLPPPGLNLHLASLRATSPKELAAGPSFSGNVLAHPTAKIGSGCKIGPDVSIGEGCVIGDGVRLSNCVVMRGVKVGGRWGFGV